MGAVLLTNAQPWQRVRQTNTTDTSFPSRVPTRTKPSGVGDAAAQTTSAIVGDNGTVAGPVQNGFRLKPYGAGSNNNTMSVRVYGWAYCIDQGNANTAFWDPTLLVELLCTLTSSVTGPAGGVVTTTDLFADTIALTTGNDDVSVDLVSPTGDVAAHVVGDFKGFAFLEVTFSTGSSATNCNALIALL